jgi:uncharacterized phage protein (TIGR01671 family)
VRVIKFRAWDKDEKTMLYAGVHDRNWYATPKNDAGGCHTIRGKMPEDRTCLEMMQFTGLLDKNGKEIYEGDVLSGWMEGIKDGKTNKIVIYSQVVWSDGQWLGLHPESHQSLRQWHTGKCEIIGNIYSNPELLGGGANGKDE